MTFHFPVNAAYNKTHNEYYKDIRRLKISGLIYGIVLIILAIIAYKGFGGDIWGIIIGLLLLILGIAGLATAPLVSMHIGRPQKFYDKHELIPAVIAKQNRNSLVLLALAPLPKGGEALVAREINKLGGLRKIGARVPAVAAGNSSGTEISPIPIAWATDDSAVLEQAKAAIPEAQWNKLNHLRSRVDEVLQTPRNLLPVE